MLPPFNVFIGTCRYLFGFWTSDRAMQKHAVECIRSEFHTLPIAQVMLLNSLAWNLFFLGLVRAAGFSDDFRSFARRWICLPSVGGSVLYYHYKFGGKTWSLTPQLLLRYAHNLCLVGAVSLVSWAILGLFTVGGLVLEWLLFPPWMRGSFYFPMQVIEDSFKLGVYFAYGLGVAVLLTLPLWMRGYRTIMGAVQRKPNIGWVELALEAVYFTCTWSSMMQFSIPISVLIGNAGFHFHVVHYMLGFLAGSCANTTLLFKFLPLHRLMHEVQPLYVMAHYEHHVCKSIHPTSSGQGLWENMIFAADQSPLAMPVLCLPYFGIYMYVFGQNLMSHAMFPHRKLLQWHTLHHVVLADVFALNSPTGYDKRHSKAYIKYHAALEANSTFITHPWVSDAVAAALSFSALYFCHHMCGWSVFAVWPSVTWG